MKALRESPCVLHLRAVAFNGPPGAEDEAFMLLDYCKGNLVGGAFLTGMGGTGRGSRGWRLAFEHSSPSMVGPSGAAMAFVANKPVQHRGSRKPLMMPWPVGLSLLGPVCPAGQLPPVSEFCTG
jgi:hypothetical protein